MYVLLLATCDTKGREAAWLKRQLDRFGVATRIVDCGCVGEPQCDVDVPREGVFRAAGTTLEALRAAGDRGRAVDAAAEGARRLALEAAGKGELAGVLGLGGSAGTTIGTAAMRALPLGLPKLMISTLAAGQVRPYVGGKDVMMLHSVVDLAGVNRISRKVLGLAVGAMTGMTQTRLSLAMADDGAEDRPLVATTMFGVTTPCVERAQEVLEEAGYEVLVFHATGSGGESFEAIVRSGLLAGALDLTTTELCDERVGGILSAGPDRLTAAAEVGLPQVVSVGATDMVNFGPRATLPAAFEGRTVHVHNANVTLLRTTAEECRAIGAELGEKVARSRGPAAILLPGRGVSAIDAEGQPFDDPAARAALFESVRTSCGEVECTLLDHHVNDPEFAEAAARKLLDLMKTA